MHGTPLLFSDLLRQFTTWLTRLGYAKSTIKGYQNHLKAFLSWLTTQKINHIQLVTQPLLEQYNAHLHQRKKLTTTGCLSSRYIQSHIYILSLLDQYLQLTRQIKLLQGKIKVTPTLFKPRAILTQEEVQSLYAATNNSLLGYRDRACLALFYGCGLRRTEGANVELKHIHYEQRLLQVLPGKTKKERYVPMSQVVIEDIKRYEQESRPYLFNNKNHNYLIVSNKGNPITPGSIGNFLAPLLAETNITKTISLHNLRHTIATHLLQSGMELTQISRFLGHKSLDSTQIYTHIANALHDG